MRSRSPSCWSSRLRESGLEAEVIETPRGSAPLGRAAAWGVLRGSGRGKPIVLLSHLDVVPADPADWTVDPFGGEVAQGYVTGRGALDAKGVAIVHLFTLTELARRGVKLSRDVIFLATPDEEMGGVAGAGWLAHERRDLLRGAAYLLTEGGGIVAGDERGSAWGIGVTEKTPCWLRITAHGIPGHGSVPARNAAVPRLIAGLERVRQLETPLRVVPEVAAMYRAMARRAPPGDGPAYANLAAALASDAAFRERFLEQRSNAALVRDTVAITVLEGSKATNMIPAVASAELDARLLPGETCEDFLEQIERTLADPGLSVEPLLAFRTQIVADGHAALSGDRARGEGDGCAGAGRAARERRLQRRALLSCARSHGLRLRAALAESRRRARHPRAGRADLDREPRARRRDHDPHPRGAGPAGVS